MPASPSAKNPEQEWRVSLPKDMAKYRDLEPFMFVLEDALLDESRGRGPPTGVSCVAAMNHLKRLWESHKRESLKKRMPTAAGLQQRYRKLFLYFLSRAEPTVGKLRLKHLSVLLNAVISQRWIDADRRRHTRKLCQDAVTQVLSEITAALDGAVASENREAMLEARRERVVDDAFQVFKQAVASTDAGHHGLEDATGLEESRSAEEEAASIKKRYGRRENVPKFVKSSFATTTLGGMSRAEERFGPGQPAASRDVRMYVAEAIRKEHGINQGTLAILCNALARGGYADEEAWQALTMLIIDSCSAPELRTQNAALIANAYAKLQRNDTALLAHLALELSAVPTSAFVGAPGARDLSNLLNSYARLGFRDATLLLHLTSAARRLHMTGAAFGAQAIANIMNALVRLDFVHEELSRDMADAALRVPPEQFDAQAVSVIVNALSKAGSSPPGVLPHLQKAMLNVRAEEWTAQAVGITVNGLANLRHHDAAALRLLRDVAIGLEGHALDPQALAAIVNAFTRPQVVELVDPQALYVRMADLTLELCEDAFNAQAAALTARAFAKPAVVRDLMGKSELVIAKMAQLAQRFPPEDYSPQAVAMLMSSVAEVPVPCSLSAARFLIQVMLGMSHYELGPGALRSIAMVCAATQELDVYDPLLLRHLSQCIQRVPLGALRPAWVRCIVTCYVHFKEAEQDQPLMEFLSQAAQHIHPSVSGHNSPATVNEFSARDLALIARAYSGQPRTDLSLFWHLAAVAQQLPFEAWIPRELADFADAFVSSGTRDEMVFDYLSRAAQHRSPFDFSPASAKLMLSAFSRARAQDPELYAHLAEAVGAGDSSALIFAVQTESDEHTWVGTGADDKLSQMIKQAQQPPVDRSPDPTRPVDLWIPGANGEKPRVLASSTCQHD